MNKCPNDVWSLQSKDNFIHYLLYSLLKKLITSYKEHNTHLFEKMAAANLHHCHLSVMPVTQHKTNLSPYKFI